MTDDLVKRLRNRAESWLEYECDDDAKIDTEAADRIEELEEALIKIAKAEGVVPSSAECDAVLWHLRTIAMATIEGKKYE